MHPLTRRQILASTAAIAVGASRAGFSAVSAATDFQFRYIVGSCMYGYLYLGEILPEVAKCGASHLDIWPKSHGNQREQLADMGEELFASLLQKHNVSLGCITQYKLGPFGLKNEMQIAQRLRCQDNGDRGQRSQKPERGRS